MALTAAQRRQLSRRTTASSRARLRARFTGPTQTVGMQQTYTPQTGLQPHPTLSPITPGRPPMIAPGSKPGVAQGQAQFVPDAQYLAAAAQAQFQRQTQLDQIKAQHDAGLQAYTESVRRLNEGVPDQQSQIQQNARKAGLFYSGQLGKQLGDFETQIARQRADLRSQFDSEDRAREAARAAILQGEPLDTAAARAEAVSRQLARDQASAAAGTLAPTPVPARRPAPKPRPRPRPRPRRRHR